MHFLSYAVMVRKRMNGFNEVGTDAIMSENSKGECVEEGNRCEEDISSWGEYVLGLELIAIARFRYLIK